MFPGAWQHSRSLSLSDAVGLALAFLESESKLCGFCSSDTWLKKIAVKKIWKFFFYSAVA